MGDSMALAELTEVKYRRMETCAAIQRRTDWRPPYALSTALELMAIELPRMPLRPQRLRRPRNLQRPQRLRRPRQQSRPPDHSLAEYSGQQCGHVTVAVPHANRKYRVEGIDAVIWRFPMDTVMVERQFACTSPACTWAMFAACVDVEELIVLGESMMRRDRRLCRATVEELGLYLDGAEDYAQQEREIGRQCRMFKGYAECRRVLPMLREGTDSSMETRTRLVLMKYGLDCPRVNYPVSVGGGKPMYLDLAYPEFRICVEYDGSHHAGQWLNDIKRRQALEDAGWKYVQVTATDLGNDTVEATLAGRVAERIYEVTGAIVPLTERMTVRRICDGRSRRRKPLYARIGFTPLLDPGTGG